jgi:uncharacterized membrane protein
MKYITMFNQYTPINTIYLKKNTFNNKKLFNTFLFLMCNYASFKWFHQHLRKFGLICN